MSSFEVWLPIAGYEGLYDVSNFGRVRSFYRGGRVLKPCLDHDGYPLVALNLSGVRKTKVLHKIVATAFHGEKRNALHREVAHLDGVRDNCRADNLKWVSRAENHFHKRFHGTHGAGERHPRAKLTADQVKIIRGGGASRPELAKRFRVCLSTIRDIQVGRRWNCGNGEAETPKA